MTEHSKHIDHLIARFLTGEISNTEKLELERWMDESEVNKKYFGDIRFVNETAIASYRILKVDVDKAWNSLHQKMISGHAGEITIGLPKKQLFIPVWLKAAAVFLLICGLSFLFYWVYQSIKPEGIKTFAVTSHNSTLNYKLADRSEVFLNKNSKITYSSLFGKKNREVTLTGEAYFNVRHSADTPFVVKAEGTIVKDIGTAFNIKASPFAATVEVYVENGEVLFYTADNSGIKVIRGERAIYDKKKKSFKMLNTKEANILSYKTRVFVFQNTPLFEVVNLINSIYNSKIELANGNLTNCRITVKFDNEDINSIVNIISETLNLKAIKTNSGYVLEGNGCINPN